MQSPWLSFAPEALYWAPRQLQKLWNVKEIYITENGTSATDKPEADGRSTTSTASCSCAST